MCSLAQAVPATPSCGIFAGNAKSLPSHIRVSRAYGGGAGTLGGAVGSAMAVGGRRGMSAIAWHPDNVRFEGLNWGSWFAIRQRDW